MAAPESLDMEALQTMMRVWVDELSTKQTESLKQNMSEIKQDTIKIVERWEELKLDTVQLKLDNINLKEELKQNIADSNKQLLGKIDDTNTRIDTLEGKFREALHEQVIRLENKQTELRLEGRKGLKDAQKQINDKLDEKLMVIKQGQDNKIQTDNEMLLATTSKTCLLYTSRCV